MGETKIRRLFKLSPSKFQATRESILADLRSLDVAYTRPQNSNALDYLLRMGIPERRVSLDSNPLKRFIFQHVCAQLHIIYKPLRTQPFLKSFDF